MHNQVGLAEPPGRMGGKESRRTDEEPRACYTVSDGAEPGKLQLVDGTVGAGCRWTGVREAR